MQAENGAFWNSLNEFMPAILGGLPKTTPTATVHMPNQDGGGIGPIYEPQPAGYQPSASPPPIGRRA